MVASHLLEVLPISFRIMRGLASHCLDGSTTFYQYRILKAVEQKYSQSDMAGIFSVSEAAISKTIGSLMEKNLLKKRQGKDKRSWDVSLTPQGKKILNTVRKQIQSELDAAIRFLPQKQQTDLENGLKALENLMLSLRGEAGNVAQKSAKTKRNK